jgi:hypothetical protein
MTSPAKLKLYEIGAYVSPIAMSGFFVSDILGQIVLRFWEKLRNISP